jgi:large conductance mechanosensitive channel
LSTKAAKDVVARLGRIDQNFAFKGNVIDLAVGIIIGAAFGKIIDSLVKQIIIPLVSLLIPSQQGYLGWKWVIDGKEVPYGQFLGEVVNFLVVSLALFLFIVKFLGWVLKARKEETVAPLPLTEDQELLTEIRDLLKDRRGVDPRAAPPESCFRLSGWRAAGPGEQTIRLRFDQPARLRRVRLVFREELRVRTQEFVLRWSPDGGRTYREMVRQQYAFSPPSTTREIEEYAIDPDSVTTLELRIVPDISGGETFASLEQMQLASN